MPESCFSSPGIGEGAIGVEGDGSNDCADRVEEKNGEKSGEMKLGSFEVMKLEKQHQISIADNNCGVD
ncbi:hypothetical protein BHE74_00025732 [Ensete ventricosum]|uniref:Uncharacterized protein n=1 Tax=Ensete ventricosum TaxID=4639 RepID=A0A444EPJ5_ENSVE|nr:hypothetical protein B296_00050403 [Ensete ventricosum]RWW12318.1 hypothetical protein GW17_00024018 [Ensete ventricosum]RWW66868.1 hypothetical protein BHE74_00025732 [Ensete ventricosum]RZS04063.1 hypothetical protein BHM03_00034335 [Ensete ventricosum]